MMPHSTASIRPFLFLFEETAVVRVVEKDGEPWFVARDVALALGYENSRKAVKDHCKGGIVSLLPSSGGEQVTKIIPEADLYRLIMRSRTAGAERFQDWVCEEVLPSIRCTGAYSLGGSAESVRMIEETRKEIVVVSSASRSLVLRRSTPAAICTHG
jgi:prophage antirepressor-like protein